MKWCLKFSRSDILGSPRTRSKCQFCSTFGTVFISWGQIFCFLFQCLKNVGLPTIWWALQSGWQVFFMTVIFVGDFLIVFVFQTVLARIWFQCDQYVSMCNILIFEYFMSPRELQMVNVLAWHANVYFALILRDIKWGGEKQSSPLLRPHKLYF